MSGGSLKIEGFEEGGRFMQWVRRCIDQEYKDEILEDIGKEGVAETIKFIKENKVKPKTTAETLARRRKGTSRSRSNRKGITLLDTGVGIKQVSYDKDKDGVEVGVPDGYMAYHQEGRVPNAPKREFLQLPDDDAVMEIIEDHLEDMV